MMGGAPGGMMQLADGGNPTLAKANAIAAAQMQQGNTAVFKQVGPKAPTLRAPIRPGLIQGQGGMGLAGVRPAMTKVLSGGQMGKTPMQVAKIGYWKNSNAVVGPPGIRPGSLNKVPAIKPKGQAPLMVPGKARSGVVLGVAGMKAAPTMTKMLPGPGMGMAKMVPA